MSAATAALEAELERAEVDDDFALTLRACSRGGSAALAAFCDLVESKRLDELPVLALAEAMADPEAAERGVRAIARAMAAQRIASAWPMTFYEVLEVVRVALPMTSPQYEHMQTLGALTACANTTDEPDTRDGQRMQFSRESLEHVIEAATIKRPLRKDMLHAIAPWTSCFQRGIKVCDAELRSVAG